MPEDLLQSAIDDQATPPAEAKGRPPGICQAGLYIAENGVGDAVGREFDMPYQASEASRNCRCCPRVCAFCCWMDKGVEAGVVGCRDCE